MFHNAFVTTTRGLQRDIPPMKLYEKAKKLGVWNPSDLDFSQDILDWKTLAADEQDLLLRLTALFQAGEEAVTLDLLPLIQVIAEEGRLEEEMYLTTFLFEEAKHTDFFTRMLAEITGTDFDLSHYHSESYRTIFYEALPQTLLALKTDTSPEAQVKASTVYNLLVEGMLAETGYHTYFTTLERNDLMPGVRKGVQLLKQDESRHIAYGIFLISRLVSEDDSLWQIVEDTMNELLMPALGVIGDAFSNYDPLPFGLVESEFIEYAMGQFQKRIERVEKARGASLDDIYRVTQKVIDTDDG